jgi:hypothetical protein
MTLGCVIDACRVVLDAEVTYAIADCESEMQFASAGGYF